MKIGPALRTIAHGFSHGTAEGQAPLQSIVVDSLFPRAEALGQQKGKPPFPMLYMMMTSPLIPRAEALGNYARPGIHSVIPAKAGIHVL